MPRWEMCRMYRRQTVYRPPNRYWRWFVWRYTVDGGEQIDQSPEFEVPVSFYRDAEYIDLKEKERKLEDIASAEKAKLIGRLLSDGWEPVEEYLLKRQAP